MMQHDNSDRLHSDEWTETSLASWLADAEYDSAEFDLPAMVTRMNNDKDVSMLDVIQDHHVARQTSVPCPEWCDLETGHRFLIDSEPGDPQSRLHQIDFTPTDVKPWEGCDETVSVQVLVPELRNGTDDSTATLGLPHLWVNVTGDFAADDARKLAAAILTATHKMQELEQ